MTFDPERGTPVVLGASFELHLLWSERVLTVGAHQTALEVLLAAGVPIEPGCLTGGCGACATDYVDGDVVHKDTCLNAAERTRSFCPCVSRAQSRIALAL